MKRSASLSASTPWQLRLFSKTLKKQQKLRLLLRQVGELQHRNCVLITNGDNSGALNYHFRSQGGHWTWIENEPEQIQEIEALLAEPVLRGDPARLPADDEQFDVVVSIDVHEHLDDCKPFAAELGRITKPGGLVVVTTPNGDAGKPVVRLKERLGMTIETYGHKVLGYTIGEHEQMLREAGLEPVASGSYSKFFTESLELAMNFAYVHLVGRKSASRNNDDVGISPTSTRDFSKVEKQYRWLALAYPALLTISKLDVLLSPTTGYAVSVVARKPR